MKNSLRHKIIYGFLRISAPSIYRNITTNRQVMMVEFIKKRYGDKGLIGCEVGVYQGEHAKIMLERLNIYQLVLIDPYLPFKDVGIDVDPSETFKIAENAVAPYKDKVCFTKFRSIDAAKTLANESLDFCYIDANHEYDYVKQDIEAYYPKVKAGGVLGGHNFEFMCQGVIRAVSEFILATGLSLYVESHDWWVIKK